MEILLAGDGPVHRRFAEQDRDLFAAGGVIVGALVENRPIAESRRDAVVALFCTGPQPGPLHRLVGESECRGTRSGVVAGVLATTFDRGSRGLVLCGQAGLAVAA